MIKFFRRIRKKLLEENRLSKYLVYAAGEIILVMIGILLALQVSNWSEEKKKKNQEQALLHQLHADFTSNLKQLDQKIRSRDIFIASAKRLLHMVDEQNSRDIDSIDFHISKVMPYATFDPIEHNLANTGELMLIRNANLKQALTRWTSNIKDVKEEENTWYNYRNDLFIPFLIKHYQLRTMRTKGDESRVRRNLSLESTNEKAPEIFKGIGYSKHIADFNALLDHPDFEDHMSRCYALNSWANSESYVLRDRILGILKMIEEDIK